MPVFPRREEGVLDLAVKMIAGFLANMGIFIHANPTALQSALGSYNDAHTDQVAKLAAAKLATEVKEARLSELIALMKAQITQAIADTIANPAWLALIGWGKKSPKSLLMPPGMPRDLDPIVQGPTSVKLVWVHPATDSGGKLRFYRIDRREEPAGGGEFSEWHQIATSIKPKIVLRDQPRGVRMEYRVVAVNDAGENESNAVDVVL